MAPQVPPSQNLGQNVNLPGNEMGSHSNTMPSGGMPNMALQQQQQQQQQLSNLVPGSQHMIANAHFQPTYAGTGCYIIHPIHFTVYIYRDIYQAWTHEEGVYCGCADGTSSPNEISAAAEGSHGVQLRAPHFLQNSPTPSEIFWLNPRLTYIYIHIYIYIIPNYYK